ncbi:MAG TPA: hypothetical protein VEH77_14610 [Roseiarcus sp.]|nr:hypothetical protein [Roseiarcus sp.]
MSATTVFLGRFIGLYLVAISVGMLANRHRTMATLDEMSRSGPWMLFSGMVATTAGSRSCSATRPGPAACCQSSSRSSVGRRSRRASSCCWSPAIGSPPPTKVVGFERFFQVWMAVVLAIGLFVTAMAFAA